LINVAIQSNPSLNLSFPSAMARVWAVARSILSMNCTFIVALLLPLVAALVGCRPATSSPEQPASPPVRLGVEILFEKRLDLVRGKRVGLITNPTGVTRDLQSIIELFRAHPDIQLVALYGPEHGVRGNAQAGEHVEFYFDDQFQLPVFSLYGNTRRAPPEMLTNIVGYLRMLDPQGVGSKLAPDAANAIDVMLFDLQDVGARAYTYIATMAHAMEVAAECGIPFVVLDRPNPINGVVAEGPMLEYPQFSSFVGLYPIPLRHGMTVGELARMFNAMYLTNKVQLTVVPMENWKRTDWFDETGLPWVIPSPNLPTFESATVYPGQVIFEGTNLSEGRGTTKPFELFGAPWIDGYTLARELNALHLPGVVFREAWFTPTFSKYKGELCGGCQLHVTDREAYRSVTTALAAVQTVKRLYGDKLEWRESFVDKLMGTAAVREALDRGESYQSIVASWEPGLTEFARQREPFLLYR
jgi:uncharacterized protein YbbC (DUF1343 family)